MFSECTVWFLAVSLCIMRFVVTLCFSGCLNGFFVSLLGVFDDVSEMDFACDFGFGSESASVRVPNDTMSVTLRVVESGASREAVSNQVTKRVNAVLARAKANRAFEVESGSRSVYPEYDEKRKGIKGWTDSADIYVKSADFAALSKLVADSQQDAMLGDVSFSVSPKKHAAAVDAASEQALHAGVCKLQDCARGIASVV